MVTVVGIGPGSGDYVTPAAEKCIRDADVVIGGKRVLEHVDTEGKEVYAITADIEGILRRIESNQERNVAVIVSGDPGFHSLLTAIRKGLPHLTLTVIPGISSIQLLFSLMAREWHDVTLLSVHGRSISELDGAIHGNARLCILTDNEITPRVIGQYLTAHGLKGRAVVGENLSYPDQRLVEVTIDELSRLEGFWSSVLYVEIDD